jgi:heme-degrading monooxygenase HmoA
MILEAAMLTVKVGEEKKFENDFSRASGYIRIIKGYRRHSLHRCLEQQNKYLLLAEWDQLEDHTIGFRHSPQYQEWKKLLHHYYDPFPIVEHYERVV